MADHVDVELGGGEERNVDAMLPVAAINELTDGTSYGCCEILMIGVAYLFLILFFPLMLCCGAIRIINDYERIIIFRCGHSRFGSSPAGAGTYFILPWVDQTIVKDLRTKTLNLPKQKLLTRDSLSINVDAVVYVHINNAAKCVINVQDADLSTKMLAQTTLRNVLGTKDLLEILANREEIGRHIQQIIDVATDPWGITVERVELTDLILPPSLERAMAAEAEAKREAQAKVIGAEGEKASALALAAASRVMAQAPGAMQLRFFQTLHSISAEKNSTIVLPFPVDLIPNAQAAMGAFMGANDPLLAATTAADAAL